jgi:hypothetical protein
VCLKKGLQTYNKKTGITKHLKIYFLFTDTFLTSILFVFFVQKIDCQLFVLTHNPIIHAPAMFQDVFNITAIRFIFAFLRNIKAFKMLLQPVVYVKIAPYGFPYQTATVF